MELFFESKVNVIYYFLHIPKKNTVKIYMGIMGERCRLLTNARTALKVINL